MNCNDLDEGVVDRLNHSCQFYQKQNACRSSSLWSDDDFDALDLCCACGGGTRKTQNQPRRMSGSSCQDTDGLLTDSYGDNCDYYTAYGCTEFYATAEFSPSLLCCACGGGAQIDATCNDPATERNPDDQTCCAGPERSDINPPCCVGYDYCANNLPEDCPSSGDRSLCPVQDLCSSGNQYDANGSACPEYPCT